MSGTAGLAAAPLKVSKRRKYPPVQPAHARAARMKGGKRI